ncbi:MAG: 2-C-methyl-D-erythritol 4-phosphate cytidylyltransferase, partial [Clostridia bacterium]|nr:2-C-methyl-D-erythritol 4-phosphate cytidylyltransferase [Clostridia bacterium]
MEITVPKLKYQIIDSNATRYPVIIVAAGSSTRMQGVNKQLAMLSGEPVLIRTLRAFDFCECISRIILVVRDEDRLMIQRLCDEYGIRKLTDLVAGGNCRHESVKNGLARLDN